MTTEPKDLRATIEQLVTALEHGILWLNVCDRPRECVPMHEAITAGREALANHKDSTPELSVGESSFEDWYQSYPRQGISKQVARDAYAAGMGDPLVTRAHPQATEPAPTQCWKCGDIDAQGQAMCDVPACGMREPAPSKDVCRNCVGQGWEPSVYKGKVPCSFCQTAPSTAGEREAWLIEVKSLGPSWICSISRENGFTRDANKAIQFPTKESAEAVLAHLWKAGRNGTVFGLDSSCYSVTEHIFLGATPPSHDAGKLVESLDGIRRYGLDTLSGRTDGPDDRDWQRQAVNEMTKRATAALLSAPALPAAAMQLADDFAAAAVNHYSAGENDKELWQKMADARQALETKLMEVK